MLYHPVRIASTYDIRLQPTAMPAKGSNGGAVEMFALRSQRRVRRERRGSQPRKRMTMKVCAVERGTLFQARSQETHATEEGTRASEARG